MVENYEYANYIHDIKIGNLLLTIYNKNPTFKITNVAKKYNQLMRMIEKRDFAE